MNTIGSRMKFIRKKEGLKQAEFAKRVLVSASYISKVESDKEKPSDIFTKLVALEFNISYAWLKDGVESPEIDKSRHDYFERSEETNSVSDETTQLIYNIQNSFQNGNSFRKMCLSEICWDLSKIIKMDMINNEKDLLIELLADYLGNLEELTDKLCMIENENDYSEKIDFYIRSYTKTIRKIFCNLSDLLVKSNK